MKIVILIAKKIHGQYTNNKLISLIYALSLMMSVLVFIYVYNNFMPSVIRVASDDSFDHYYSFYFSEEIADISNLREYLKSYDTRYVMYYHKILQKTNENNESNENNEFKIEYEIIQGDSDEAVKIDGSTSNTGSAIPYIVSYKDDIVITSLVEGRLEFSDEEKEGTYNAAILPANSTLGVLPSSFEYNDMNYNAVGWHVGAAMIIPENVFVEQELDVYKVEIYLNDILNASEHRKLIEDICRMYSVDGIVSPENMDDQYQGNSRQVMFIIVIGFLIMIFVFGYLLKYLLMVSKNENMIYRLVGAGNGEIIAIIALENLVINVFLSIFSVCIHAALFDSVFDKVNFYQGVRLGVNDYIIIIGITTVFSFIAVLPHIIRTVTNTLISNKSRI